MTIGIYFAELLKKAYQPLRGCDTMRLGLFVIPAAESKSIAQDWAGSVFFDNLRLQTLFGKLVARPGGLPKEACIYSRPKFFVMPMVYITCPATENILETHHILSDVEKLRERIDRHIPVPCPYCHTNHEWTDDNGFFLSQGEKSPLIGKDVEL